LTTIGIGVDQIPDKIKKSNILTGNNLGTLGNVELLPTAEEITLYKTSHKLSFKNEDELHKFAKQLLEGGKVKEAWMALLGS
jgi:hypothetical protein